TTRAAAEQQRSYVTANVLLMGDTGVGKSGLTERLVRGHFVQTKSTHGRRTEELRREDVTDDATGATLQRRILLWDLAGQPEYRVVHQLSLHNATLACVLFDSHRATDPFESPTYWGQALAQAHPHQPVPKVLVASRIDVGGLPASPDSIDAFRAEHAFEHFIATSAISGEGCAALAQLIQDTIPWDRLTVYSTNQRLETLREFVRQQVPPPVTKQQPGVYPLRLVTVEALHAAFGRTTDQAPTLADFSRDLRQIEHSGDVRLLAFRPTGDTPPPGNDPPQPTDYVLLDPTRHDAYASALLLAARNQPHGPGHLPETAIKADELRLPAEDRLADSADEKRLLWFVLDDLVRCDLALREEIEGAPYVVFPSQCITELTFPGTAAFGMAFGFAGPVRNIYATLIAQLAHYTGFRHERKPAFYRDAAVYHTPTGDCILRLRDTGKGHAELDALFDPSTPDAVRQGFIEFVERHLHHKAVPGSVTQRYAYHCRTCGYAFEDKIVRKRLADERANLLCPDCETTTPLRALDTEPTPATQDVVKQMEQDAEEGRERMSAEVIIKAKEDQ
ncbi:MAG: GTP-binding protein, partial [Hymenobacteraceae bacterium]|nr:GTP-binding protein [Hymenobacteraceae bacterium]